MVLWSPPFLGLVNAASSFGGARDSSSRGNTIEITRFDPILPRSNSLARRLEEILVEEIPNVSHFLLAPHLEY